MKPETRTVNDLFEMAVRYQVPLYQRPYVWTQDKQWQPLWDDIFTLLEHQERGDAQHYSHFLGALVLEHVTQAPGRIPVYTVIDGQQRLTTLQILLSALAYVAKGLGAEEDGALIRDLVQNDPRRAKGHDLLKVWPTNANRSAFVAVMSEDFPSPTHTDDPTNLIDEAHAFFASAARSWVTDAPADHHAKRLDTLLLTVCHLLKVVAITLEPEDNAQVIFETLNARGTPLLALDLVKNAVFLQAERRGLDTDHLYEQTWKPQLDDDYWRRERRQGRLSRPAGELFLMHWLTMKLEKVPPATELFNTFRNNFVPLKGDEHPAAPGSVEALVTMLCRDAKTMRSFDSFERGTDEWSFFQRLEALDTTTVLPLVLLMFSEPAVNVERRRRALRVLESWLVRRMLLGLTTKNYNNFFPSLVGRVAADVNEVDAVLVAALQACDTELDRWPTDDELRSRLTQQPLYGQMAQQRIVMVLAAVERSLYSNLTDALEVPRRLSIEHIIPQSWKQHWPLANELAGDAIKEAEAARDDRIHRLGNLTLVAKDLNSLLSNAEWNVKQTYLNPETRLLLNVRLIEKHPERFDEACVDERGALLAERILSIWPGPDAW